MSRLRWLTITILALVVTSTLPSPEFARAQIYSPYWVIYDVDDGIVLDSERMDERVPMASLTKVMTGLLAVENLSMSDEITIVEEDLVGEAAIWVEPDDVLTVRTLLHGMMMRSGNDAASALARAAGGSPDRESQVARDRFVDMMNQRAAELGMRDTRFENPHGLDGDEHYSTARDLVRLTEEVLRNPQLLQPFGASIYSGEGYSFDHTNQLPKQYEGVLGGKTGWTNNAGLCLIEVVQNDGRTLIVVLLGSTFERWYPDAIDLFDYGWTIPRPAASPEEAVYAFEWWRDRTDGPIERGEDSRSWLWGPRAISSVRAEQYQEAPGGVRLVQYFDKGRMEINDPEADITSGWYVTGGHLAMELISGNHQRGDDAFVYRGPARVPVAGDPDGDGPTYADLAILMESEHQQPGDTITLSIDHAGNARQQSRFDEYEVELLETAVPTEHGIASVFDEYLDSTGPVVERGQTITARLFSPRFALIGLPITEPAWTRVPVDGVMRDVLVQCFERRCLTYTPDNPEDWQVEMGNIGLHYREWTQSNRLLTLFDLPDRQDRSHRPSTPDRFAGT